MKSIQKMFFLATALVSTQLYGMEESRPTMAKKIHSLKEIAYATLNPEQVEYVKANHPEFVQQEKETIEKINETAQFLLELLKSTDAQEREAELGKLSVQRQFNVALAYLNFLSQNLEEDPNNRQRIYFVEYFLRSADTHYLSQMRRKLISSNEILRKVFQRLPLVQRPEKAKNIAARSQWFTILINFYTQELTKTIAAKCAHEELPYFDQEFEDQAKLFIMEQDRLHWTTFNKELLQESMINPEMFLNYLFAVHIPTKQFDNPKKSFEENGVTMTMDIDTIVQACHSLVDHGKLLKYLFELYPEATNMLFNFNEMISIKGSPMSTFKSTLLHPKLYVMYRLMNIFSNQQCNSLMKLLDDKQIEECAEKICLNFYNFLDTRLVIRLLKDIQKRIFASMEQDAIKHEFLIRFADCLTLCLSKIRLSPESVCELFKALATTTRNHFNKPDQATRSKELVEVLKKSFENIKNNWSH